MQENNLNLRQKFRQEDYTGTTAGMAADYVQANVVILPVEYAFDFLSFCQANPKPCPLIAISDVGDCALGNIAVELDIRTDLPSYDIYRNGVYEQSCHNINSLWQKDFVTFLIGCSFSFEQSLLDNDIKLRHLEENKNVSMYNTSIMLKRYGFFKGSMVVSMRPMLASDAIKAIQITGSMPKVHGAPVHIGHPEAIGIRDLSLPDYGDSVNLYQYELPVFWACGVTPVAVIKAAKLPLAITHTPGCMLITDIKNHRFYN